MESLCKTDVPLAQESLHPEHATLCVHVYARVCTYVHMHPCVWCVILYVCVHVHSVHVCDRQGTGVLLQTDSGTSWEQSTVSTRHWFLTISLTASEGEEEGVGSPRDAWFCRTELRPGRGGGRSGGEGQREAFARSRRWKSHRPSTS